MKTEPPDPDDWSFNTERPSSNLGVALQLAEAGLAVFPCGQGQAPAGQVDVRTRPRMPPQLRVAGNAIRRPSSASILRNRD